ncbi:MAG: ral secretion pathway protein [Candidatus Nomurabacteria bacterium]|nr:ral secretion pathway protein [Candidatus Nomurabacteria bacterium]
MLLLDLFVSQNKLTELEAKDIESDISVRDDILVDSILVKKNITTEEITEVRSILYGLPIFKGDISDDKELTKYISVQQSKQLLSVPLSEKDGVVTVGVVDPEHANVLDSLQFLFGKDHIAYKVFLITYDAYKKHFGINSDAPLEKTSLTDKVGDEVLSYISKDDGEKGKETTGEDIDLTAVTSAGLDSDLAKLSIPEIFSIILRYAIDNGASDIHIEHIGTGVRARVRLDGQLETITTLPVKMHPMLLARVKILCGMKLDEKRKPQDGRFSTKFGDHTIDYRVSTFPGYYGEKVVIRILDSYKGVRPVDTLGFSDGQMKEIRNALARPYGIILICGPTGSGKTTTLYAMLNEIDREHRNVVSLEDPIEYNVPSMNQSQIFPEIGYTFASGLRSILRQDPDVIMVGEIRDAETAQLAIQAALTGHLVFSTIHTNTAVGVITRLLDMGIEPYLIAPTIIATIGQRLSRGIAEGCAKPMEINDGMKEMIAEQFKDLPEQFKSKLPLDKPLNEVKTSEKFPTGMKGRVPVFEVLTFTPPIQDAVLHSKGEEEIWHLARANGMMTMKEDAIIKSINGLIPFVEINEL